MPSLESLSKKQPKFLWMIEHIVFAHCRSLRESLIQQNLVCQSLASVFVLVSIGWLSTGERLSCEKSTVIIDKYFNNKN